MIILLHGFSLWALTLVYSPSSFHGSSWWKFYICFLFSEIKIKVLLVFKTSWLALFLVLTQGPTWDLHICFIDFWRHAVTWCLLLQSDVFWANGDVDQIRIRIGMECYCYTRYVLGGLTKTDLTARREPVLYHPVVVMPHFGVHVDLRMMPLRCSSQVNEVDEINNTRTALLELSYS